MISSIIIMIVCAVLYSIKGGQHYKLRRYVEHKAGIEHYANGQPIEMSIPQYIVHRIMDGKSLSALLFGVLALIVTSEYKGGMEYSFHEGAWWFYFAAVAAWLLAVSPKMGRVVGMIGGYKGNWDENEQPYTHESEDKMIEGWKSGFMRGVWIGAMMAILFWNPIMIITGALYPVTAWLGVSFEQWRTGLAAAPWQWHEPLCGAFCIGLGIALI
jgi:hypothetical protein